MAAVPFIRPGAALAVALAVLAGVAGCGRDADPAPTPTPTSAASGPVPSSAVPSSAVPSGAVPDGASSSAAVPPSAAPVPTRSTAPAPAGSGRCHTSELSVAFGPVNAGAGQRQGTVILQNESARRCTIFGFGGLQVLDAARRPLPVVLRRVGPAPTLVRFGPRSDQITKTIGWGAIPAGVACVRPVYVLVTPPDETDPLTARWPYGAVCSGRIDGFAYGAGR
jgi:hypothetical protein